MTKDSISPSAYSSIFINAHPLIDVRAPVEYTKGAFPNSHNHYLLHDNERTQIGTCYKKHGQVAAIKLGHSLIKADIKQQRINQWIQYIKQEPHAYLYCFRGGLRSQIAQQWLKEVGYTVPFIEGGYKAMRQFLIQSIDKACHSQSLIVLSGTTGSGKTLLLSKWHNSIDLEDIAKHRGSSFGQYFEPQPSQINFENTLAIELLKLRVNKPPWLLIEDESYLIGRAAIPKNFYQKMQLANILVLEETMENRVTRILQDYIINMYEEFSTRLGIDEGQRALQKYLTQGLMQIKKRLGGKLHDELQRHLKLACQRDAHKNISDDHRIWITKLLSHYYDPMYQYQLDKKQSKIVFQGDHLAINQWLNNQYTSLS
ncbi:tRNA 2-selenouridine(34) synthase MnmH [uncultured Shewanella sp.]|uniref:tRNA 2-selenouridine(34) synthase MnmH n=1 Tax=uncultured Shewanella sp. TaxID=173975 RepID=UPI002634B0CD|nr:tRNA 2-selenouridine(34) synthase MnmH [uncultured Shewanella sp.]